MDNALPSAVLRFWRRLCLRLGDRQFCSTAALRADPVIASRNKITDKLRVLVDYGYVGVGASGLRHAAGTLAVDGNAKRRHDVSAGCGSVGK